MYPTSTDAETFYVLAIWLHFHFCMSLDFSHLSDISRRKCQMKYTVHWVNNSRAWIFSVIISIIIMCACTHKCIAWIHYVLGSTYSMAHLWSRFCSFTLCVFWGLNSGHQASIVSFYLLRHFVALTLTFKMSFRDWKDDSTVKNTYWSCRGPEFCSLAHINWYTVQLQGLR